MLVRCFNMQWPAFSNHNEAQYWKYMDLAEVDQFLGDDIAIPCKLPFAVIYSHVSHHHLTLSLELCFTLKAESRKGILFPHLLFSQLCISIYWRLKKWASAAYEVLNGISSHRKIHELNDNWDKKTSWEREVWSSDKTEAMEVRLGSLHRRAISYWPVARGLHRRKAQRQRRWQFMGKMNIQKEPGICQELHSVDVNWKQSSGGPLAALVPSFTYSLQHTGAEWGGSSHPSKELPSSPGLWSSGSSTDR